MNTEPKQFSIRFLSGFTLKVLACILMLIDHTGFLLFPRVTLLRIIGRLAFPIFAFFIAEGCKYTRNRLKRLLLLLIPGILFEAVYVIYAGEVEGNVFLTFSLSVILIYAVQYLKAQFFSGTVYTRILSLLLFLSSLAVTAILATVIGVDYGFVGVLTPVIIAFTYYKEGENAEIFRPLDTHAGHLIALLIGTVLLSLDAEMGSTQTWCLLSVPILLFYNGKPGYRGCKYLFYVFYPAHLLLLEGISMLLSNR